MNMYILWTPNLIWSKICALWKNLLFFKGKEKCIIHINFKEKNRILRNAYHTCKLSYFPSPDVIIIMLLNNTWSSSSCLTYNVQKDKKSLLWIQWLKKSSSSSPNNFERASFYFNYTLIIGQIGSTFSPNSKLFDRSAPNAFELLVNSNCLSLT